MSAPSEFEFPKQIEFYFILTYTFFFLASAPPQIPQGIPQFRQQAMQTNCVHIPFTCRHTAHTTPLCEKELLSVAPKGSHLTPPTLYYQIQDQVHWMHKLTVVLPRIVVAIYVPMFPSAATRPPSVHLGPLGPTGPMGPLGLMGFMGWASRLYYFSWFL